MLIGAPEVCHKKMVLGAAKLVSVPTADILLLCKSLTLAKRTQFKPSKTELLPNNTLEFSSYLTGNALRLRYEGQQVCAV
jgi:hypothetical protein